MNALQLLVTTGNRHNSAYCYGMLYKHHTYSTSHHRLRRLYNSSAFHRDVCSRVEPFVNPVTWRVYITGRDCSHHIRMGRVVPLWIQLSITRIVPT